MKRSLLAAAAAVIAGPALAQTPMPESLILPGATAAPDCGNLYGLAGKAFCVSAPLAAIGTLADAYVAELEGQGWLPAGGDANRVVFVRRRDGGGLSCPERSDEGEGGQVHCWGTVAAPGWPAAQTSPGITPKPR